MVLCTNLNRALDITCQCAICGKSGYTFDNYEELKITAKIRKSYIPLCVAL